MNPSLRRRFACLPSLFVFLLAWTGCNRQASGPRFETSPVKRGNITQRITATGTLVAVISVDVGSQISGTILTLHADFNTPVKKDQLVAQIDPRIFQAWVNQAEGDLASSRAALELAQLTAARKKDLVSQKAAPQGDLDKAIAELHQAEANIIIKQAVLEKAKADLDHCDIKAPVDGIVIARKIDVGQTVAASFTTPVLFTIANDLTKMRIDASVSEADIGQVAVGQKVEFTVDAFPDVVFEGKVSQVRRAPITVENVVTYDTVIDVENPEQKLFPGMTADVSILIAERKNVLKVPNSALRFIPPDTVKLEAAKDAPAQAETTVFNSHNQRLVYFPSGTPKGPTLRGVRVKVGITDGATSEVLEGLKEGDGVVTATMSKDAKGF